MIEKLKLTEEQVRDILDTDSFFRTKQATLKTELRELQLDMKQICMAESFDKRILLQIADQIAELKKTLYLEETEARLAIRYLLTPEQVEKLRLNRTKRTSRWK
jgi:Spy/CpxP family protein refolding chaperone